jgi:hypothetical protein
MRLKKLSVLAFAVTLALPFLKTPGWSQALIDPNGLQVYMAADGPHRWGDDYGGWHYKLWNGDQRGDSANIFQVSGIPITPAHIYVDPLAVPGWRFIGAFSENNGKTTVSWSAVPGYEVQPGTWAGFWVWGFNAWKTAEGSYCAIGGSTANCSPAPVMSW